MTYKEHANRHTENARFEVGVPPKMQKIFSYFLVIKVWTNPFRKGLNQFDSSWLFFRRILWIYISYDICHFRRWHFTTIHCYCWLMIPVLAKSFTFQSVRFVCVSFLKCNKICQNQKTLSNLTWTLNLDLGFVNMKINLSFHKTCLFFSKWIINSGLSSATTV